MKKRAPFAFLHVDFKIEFSEFVLYCDANAIFLFFSFFKLYEVNTIQINYVMWKWT